MGTRSWQRLIDAELDSWSEHSVLIYLVLRTSRSIRWNSSSDRIDVTSCIVNAKVDKRNCRRKALRRVNNLTFDSFKCR